MSSNNILTIDFSPFENKDVQGAQKRKFFCNLFIFLKFDKQKKKTFSRIIWSNIKPLVHISDRLHDRILSYWASKTINFTPIFDIFRFLRFLLFFMLYLSCFRQSNLLISSIAPFDVKISKVPYCLSSTFCTVCPKSRNISIYFGNLNFIFSLRW